MDMIDIYEDEEEEGADFYYRNARTPRRRFNPARPLRAAGRTAMIRRAPTRPPIVQKYGSLKWGLIADAAAKALAAIAPLPGAPTMGEDATKNLQNLADYHEALAEHAKRAQQLTTLGSIAKVFLP